MSKDSRKMSHIFNRCRQHQFYPVDLVDFAGTGIVVDGNDVGFRESLAQLLDHAFSYHMIRHANGCVQTMFGAPLWISSTISPVRNQPSPV